ncbi:MAG TPA: hypothetical protein V6C86_09510 [Oculatellaceae cyanobacterium]
MRHLKLVVVGALLFFGNLAVPALADQFKMPEELGRVEGNRDLNLIQVEPTVIHERYYTTGQCERHQYVGNTLAAGAEIPDSDPAPVKATVRPVAGQSPTQTVAPRAVPKSP